MKTFSHLHSSRKRLSEFLIENSIEDNSSILIQVFMSSSETKKMQTILDDIHSFLPSANVIATSTAGEIVAGGMQDDTTVVSVSIFEKTKVDVALIEGENEDEIAFEVSKMINPRTKLVIMFNNVYVNDGEKILNYLEQSDPKVMIAGGNAGDNGEFGAQTVVGAMQNVSHSGLAIAVLNSDDLLVHNSHFFNWQSIGEFLTITKSEGSVIHEIDYTPAQQVYREYLGNEVANSLPGSGVEFPLVFSSGELNVARAPVALGDNGALIMAGSIAEGTKVQFAFGDVAQNDKSVQEEVEKFSTLPIESIFIYSCSARKYFLNNHLNSELELLEKIAPTSGFITYGEFFKQDQCNKMLNVTSTFIGLSEDANAIHKIDFQEKWMSKQTRTLNALTHLVHKTTNHLHESIHSLSTFQELIKASTIYSKTDVKGIITDVNDRFCTLSGYSREELIGSSHNIVRHEDMPKETYVQMWKNLRDKKPWNGLIKNKAKNGKAYYVRSHIFPIFDTSNNILEYISLRDDVSEEIEKHNRLEGNLNELQEFSKEKEFLLNQYEKVIDLNSAFIRMNPNFNLVYVNEVFCTIYECESQKIVNNNIQDFMDSKYFVESFWAIKEMLLTTGNWKGVIPFKDHDKTIYMETKINTIYDTNDNIVEYMMALHNITDLITAQKEIEETQKDVVFTMGAIGETRSKETGNHVKRVAEYSKILALYYGLDEVKAELLKMASPMHDIGKVGIPDAILNKPGKLDDEEWVIMKSHAVLGYDMLKNSKREILKTAAIVAYTHHEKWDGSGYPKGLRGEEIDICGRITAVADVFDALGSDRCYKKAWDDEKIFSLLKDQSGKHFDPKLIEIFFEHLDEFLAIRDKFVD